jgi:hypothetical protein
VRLADLMKQHFPELPHVITEPQQLRAESSYSVAIGHAICPHVRQIRAFAAGPTPILAISLIVSAETEVETAHQDIIVDSLPQNTHSRQ